MHIAKQLSIEKAMSLGLLPTISRTPSSPTKRGYTTPSPPVVSETTLTVGAGLIICLLLFLTFHGHTSGSQPNGTSAASSAQFGTRNWKDVDMTRSQSLEMQLEQRDEEINLLKQKIMRISASRTKAESNMQAQESVIKSLQQRQETEKVAKHRAIHALTERTKTLDECVREQQHLEVALSYCHQELAEHR